MKRKSLNSASSSASSSASLSGSLSSRSDVSSPPSIGRTIQRLRKAYNMSLGSLSETSGVAKSIISQIERNETNPTLATVWRLSRALERSIEDVMKDAGGGGEFLERCTRAAIPVLTSEDGKCTLTILGALSLVNWVQWYDFRASPGGVLESEAHQPGCVEHLSVLSGSIRVRCDDEEAVASEGETLRYRGDRPHSLTNDGDVSAHATMVDIVRLTVFDGGSS